MMMKLYNYQKIIFNYFLLAGSVLAGIYLRWDLILITVLALFVWIILTAPKPIYFLCPALFFLILSPFSSLVRRPEYSEEFAILAFYFLILFVIAIIGYHDEK